MSKEIKGGRMSGKTLFDEEEELTPLEALKRIRQETIPATYNQDFDKEECCKIIETALKALEIIKPYCLVADYKTDDPDTRYELAFCKKICITKEEYELLKEVLL